MTVETITGTRAYIDMLASFQPPNEMITPSQWVLGHGQQWGGRVFPKGIKKAKSGQCFKNAFHLADRDSSLRYVEGWAMSVIPMEHAWCVDKYGNVIDNTWDKKFKLLEKPYPQDYFGVVLSQETLYKIMLETKVFGVFGSWWAWDRILPILESSIADTHLNKGDINL